MILQGGLVIAGEQLAQEAERHGRRPGGAAHGHGGQHHVDGGAGVQLEGGHTVLVRHGAHALVVGIPRALHGERGARRQHPAIRAGGAQVDAVAVALREPIGQLRHRRHGDGVLGEQHRGRALHLVSGGVGGGQTRHERGLAAQVLGHTGQHEAEAPGGIRARLARQSIPGLLIEPRGGRRPAARGPPVHLHVRARHGGARAVEDRALEDRGLARAPEGPRGLGLHLEARQGEGLDLEGGLARVLATHPAYRPPARGRARVERERSGHHAPGARGQALLEHDLARGIRDEPGPRPALQGRQIPGAQGHGAKTHLMAGLVEGAVGEHLDASGGVEGQGRLHGVGAQRRGDAGAQPVVPIRQGRQLHLGQAPIPGLLALPRALRGQGRLLAPGVHEEEGRLQAAHGLLHLLARPLRHPMRHGPHGDGPRGLAREPRGLHPHALPQAPLRTVLQLHALEHPGGHAHVRDGPAHHEHAEHHGDAERDPAVVTVVHLPLPPPLYGALHPP